VSEVQQTVSVSAVRKADNAAVCVPAFASVSKNVSFGCGYSDPASGTLPVRVGGAAVSCGAGTQTVSLAFNAGGVATTTVQYADVGRIALNASYTGAGSDAGLVMTGTDDFVAAPATLTITNLTAGNIAAGTNFNATLNAFNNAGAATPNFGREAARQFDIGMALRTPTGGSSGSFVPSYGAFAGGGGVVTMTWSEVGTIDLTATVADYLGSGLAANADTGSGGALRIIPHHFDVTLAQPAACTAGATPFTYYDQPFSATVTARNASGGTTTNYNGSLANTAARSVTLLDPAGLGGSYAPTSIGPAEFGPGFVTRSIAYGGFATRQAAPGGLVVRVRDSDNVTSQGYTEPAAITMRSGRLRLFNAFGSEKQPLQLQLQAEYWSGAAWMLNSADACTSVAASAVALSNVRDGRGAPAAWTTGASTSGALVGGRGTLTLAAPSGGATGSVEVALNLGSGGNDQSCLASHPATTGAALPWLRSQNGSCSALWDRDPSARASFGIYSPETRKTVHARELY